MSRIRLILIPPSAALPATCLTLDAQGRVLTRGVVELGGPQPEPMRTVAIAPGADVLVRWLDLPAGGAAQQRAAALWALKDKLATRPERLSLALGPVTAAGQPRLAAAVDTALLEAWRDHRSAVGAPADVLFPDSLIAPEPEDAEAATVITLGAHNAVRLNGSAQTVQADLAPLIVGERPASIIDDEATIQVLMIQAALRPPVDLLDAGRKAGSDRRGWLRAAILAGLLVISPLVLIGAAGLRDSLAADRAGDQAPAGAVQAAPASDPVRPAPVHSGGLAPESARATAS